MAVVVDDLSLACREVPQLVPPHTVAFPVSLFPIILLQTTTVRGGEKERGRGEGERGREREREREREGASERESEKRDKRERDALSDIIPQAIV